MVVGWGYFDLNSLFFLDRLLSNGLETGAGRIADGANRVLVEEV